jgi:hypothetical protein
VGGHLDVCPVIAEASAQRVALVGRQVPQQAGFELVVVGVWGDPSGRSHRELGGERFACAHFDCVAPLAVDQSPGGDGVQPAGPQEYRQG